VLRFSLLTLNGHPDHPPSCPLLEALLPCGPMIGAAENDPKRQFTTANYRSAKGSLDYLVDDGEYIYCNASAMVENG
jgi:hypothetical protein